MKRYTTNGRYNTPQQIGKIISDLKDNKHVWIDKHHTGSGATTAYYKYVELQDRTKKYCLVEQNRNVALDKAQIWRKLGNVNIKLWSMDTTTFKNMASNPELPTLHVYVMDTFLKRNKNDYDAVMVDECHAIVSDSLFRKKMLAFPTIMKDRFPETPVLYITATPYNKNDYDISLECQRLDTYRYPLQINVGYTGIPENELIAHYKQLPKDTGLIIYAPHTNVVFGLYELFKTQLNVSVGGGGSVHKRAIYDTKPNSPLTSPIDPDQRVLILTKSTREGFDANKFIKYSFVILASQVNDRTCLTNQDLVQIIGRCRTQVRDVTIYQSGQYNFGGYPRYKALLNKFNGMTDRLQLDVKDHSLFMDSDKYTNVQKASANQYTSFHMLPYRKSTTTNDNWKEYTEVYDGRMVSIKPRIDLLCAMSQFDPQDALDGQYGRVTFRGKRKSEKPKYVLLNSVGYSTKNFLSYKPRRIKVDENGKFSTDIQTYENNMWIDQVNNLTFNNFFREFCNKSHAEEGLNDIYYKERDGKIVGYLDDFYKELIDEILDIMVKDNPSNIHTKYYRVLKHEKYKIEMLCEDIEALLPTCKKYFVDKIKEIKLEIRKPNKDTDTEALKKQLERLESPETITREVIFSLYGIYNYNTQYKQYREYNALTTVGGTITEKIVADLDYKVIPADLNQIAPKVAFILGDIDVDFRSDAYDFFDNGKGDRKKLKVRANKFLNSCNWFYIDENVPAQRKRHKKSVLRYFNKNIKELNQMFDSMVELGTRGGFFQVYSSVEKTINSIITHINSLEVRPPRLHDAVYLSDEFMREGILGSSLLDPSIRFTVNGKSYQNHTYQKGWIDTNNPDTKYYCIDINTKSGSICTFREEQDPTIFPVCEEVLSLEAI